LNNRFGLILKIDKQGKTLTSADEQAVSSSRALHNRKGGSVVQTDQLKFQSPQAQKDMNGNWKMSNRLEGNKMKDSKPPSNSGKARNKYGSMGANEYLNEILLSRKSKKSK
jgi:hypothetical protein